MEVIAEILFGALLGVLVTLFINLLGEELISLIRYIKDYKYRKRVSKKELETWTPEKFLGEYYVLDWEYTRSAKKLILKTIQFKYGGIKALEEQVYNKMAEQMKDYPYHSHLLNPNPVIHTGDMTEDVTEEEVEYINKIVEKHKKEKINMEVD